MEGKSHERASRRQTGSCEAAAAVEGEAAREEHKKLSEKLEAGGMMAIHLIVPEFKHKPVFAGKDKESTKAILMMRGNPLPFEVKLDDVVDGPTLVAHTRLSWILMMEAMGGKQEQGPPPKSYFDNYAFCIDARRTFPIDARRTLPGRSPTKTSAPKSRRNEGNVEERGLWGWRRPPRAPRV